MTLVAKVPLWCSVAIGATIAEKLERTTAPRGYQFPSLSSPPSRSPVITAPIPGPVAPIFLHPFPSIARPSLPFYPSFFPNLYCILRCYVWTFCVICSNMFLVKLFVIGTSFDGHKPFWLPALCKSISLSPPFIPASTSGKVLLWCLEPGC